MAGHGSLIIQKLNMALELPQLNLDHIQTSIDRFAILESRRDAKRRLEKLKCAINNKNIDVNLLDDNGKSALQILIENLHKFINIYGKKDLVDIFKTLLSKGASVDFVCDDGQSTLHHAIALKDEDITRIVLEKIKNVNVRDKQGNTPLLFLLYNTMFYENERVIFKIMKRIRDKGGDIHISNLQQVTPSHLAAKKKYLDILNNFLIQPQCKVNMQLQDGKGNTIFHRLLKKSAHLSKGEVPEQSAHRSKEEPIKIKNKFMKIVYWILSAACLENIQNSSGETLAHLAADCYHYEILEKILPENINVQDSKGETILHILVRRFSGSNIHIIERLLKLGANISLKNHKTKTPFELAFEKGNELLLELLLTEQPSNNPKQYSTQIGHD